MPVPPDLIRTGVIIPEDAKGGAKEGGGAKPHEETPHGQFPTPLTTARFAPPLPPFHFSWQAP